MPRLIGMQTCEFKGLGILPVVHKQFLDEVRAGLENFRVQEQLAAFDNPRRLVAVQIDKGDDGELGFVQWWGILVFDNFQVSNDGKISFDVVDRMREWPE